MRACWNRAVTLAFAWIAVTAAGCGRTGFENLGDTDDSGVGESDATAPSVSGRSSGSGGSSGEGHAGGSGTGSSSGSAASGLAVDAGNPAADAMPTVVAQLPLRMTDTEYANTVSDLMSVPQSEQTVPLAPDYSAGGFAVGALLGDAVAQGYHDSAVAIASQVAAATDTLLDPLGCDVSDGSRCASAFIDAFAPLAFRHGTVDPATIAGLNSIFATIAQAAGGATTTTGFQMGLQAVLEEILQSPYFLYHLELEEEAKGLGLVAVTGYSLANRLSYLLWASMPDDTLFASAAAGTLNTAADVLAQANRMVGIAGSAADQATNTPKAHLGAKNFWSQWLQPVLPQTFKSGNSTQITTQGALSSTSLYSVSGNTGESFASVYTQAVQADLQASFDMQVDRALWSPNGSMSALLTGTTAYADANIAQILGVQTDSSTLTPVQVNTSERIGILSHPVLMSTYATPSTSHPLARGRFVWEQILCQPVPDPPPNGPPFTPPAAGTSLRQAYEMLDATGAYAGEPRCPMVGQTSSQGQPCEPLGTDGQPSPCPACHARMDSVGFLFESFDTLGDFRTIDDYGQPVDLANITVVQAADPALNVLTADSMAFAKNLAASDAPNACLTEMLYEFATHRADTAADYPIETELDEIFDQSNQDFVLTFAELTQIPPFLYRVNVP